MVQTFAESAFDNCPALYLDFNSAAVTAKQQSSGIIRKINVTKFKGDVQSPAALLMAIAGACSCTPCQGLDSAMSISCQYHANGLPTPFFITP